MDDKRALRARIRALRQSLSPEERAEAGRLIEQRVIDMPEYESASVVLLYASTDEEVDTEGLIDRAAAEGKTVLLPRIEGETLALHRILGREDLSPGPYGIFEPRLTLPAVSPSEVDLAIVPGVAFDEHGHRLGMGKAFYDRLLPQLGAAFTAGVAFDVQLVPEVPYDPHDKRVDAVVTETRLIRVTE